MMTRDKTTLTITTIGFVSITISMFQIGPILGFFMMGICLLILAAIYHDMA